MPSNTYQSRPTILTSSGALGFFDQAGRSTWLPSTIALSPG